MDIDPFEAIGIAPVTAHFLDVFLLHCLVSPSPNDTRQEIEAIGRNKQAVAARGREPGLVLERLDGRIPLHEWTIEMLDQCVPVAEKLDAAYGGRAYRDALAAVGAAARSPGTLPSARELDEIAERFGGSYARFALTRSLEHRSALKAEPLPADVMAEYDRIARESLTTQRTIEAADKLPFETYRQNYLSPDALSPNPDEDPAGNGDEVENAVGV